MITISDLNQSQPAPITDPEHLLFYVSLANKLADAIPSTELGSSMPEGLVKRLALTLTDYMQDVVADAGVWRSFIVANKELFGYKIPFFEIDESYIDYELNLPDVQFLVWYVIAMLWENYKFINPLDSRIQQLSKTLFVILESQYEDAPVCEEFNIARGLEFSDTEDHKKIYALGNWLFLHSYLLTPAFADTMHEFASEINPEDTDFATKLNKRLDESMMNETTGPLALFIPEWVYLMLEGRLPKQTENFNPEPHKYYKSFTEFTGGRDIMFFDSYESLNQFFIEALGWEEGQEHLSQVKGQHDYVLMVERDKGMLMAMNVARCIACHENQLYDQNFAEKNAFSLLIMRGLCPGDLLRRIFREGWLPDAHWPDSDDHEFTAKYADFIARCYLQSYYRGD